MPDNNISLRILLSSNPTYFMKTIVLVMDLVRIIR